MSTLVTIPAKFKRRESLASKLRFPVTRVILLSSNPRSGSSLLGDVLTPPPVAASYFYEPLRFLYESVPRYLSRTSYCFSLNAQALKLLCLIQF